MTISDMLADQARVFQDFPTETITINSVSYPALVLQWGEGSAIELGGYETTLQGTVAIERSLLSAAPAEGTLATFRGASYRIGTTDSSDDAASWTLHLHSPERK